MNNVYFVENKYEQCLVEHTLYIKKHGGRIMFIALYVDDLVFMGNDAELIKKFKRTMEKEFEMTDLLLSVGIVSRYMEELTYTHWRALKRILRYVRGTTSLGLYYTRSDDYRLVGYSDSDWCGDVDDWKSTSGYVFFMSNTTFTWLSKNQPIVTWSTCEAEYVAASLSVCHAIWLRNLLSKLEMKQKGGTVIRIDNKSAIELAKNSVNHGRNKHIDVKFHSIRE